MYVGQTRLIESLLQPVFDKLRLVCDCLQASVTIPAPMYRSLNSEPVYKISGYKL